jgi:hypothetical protein
VQVKSVQDLTSSIDVCTTLLSLSLQICCGIHSLHCVYYAYSKSTEARNSATTDLDFSVDTKALSTIISLLGHREKLRIDEQGDLHLRQSSIVPVTP